MKVKCGNQQFYRFYIILLLFYYVIRFSYTSYNLHLYFYFKLLTIL